VLIAVQTGLAMIAILWIMLRIYLARMIVVFDGILDSDRGVAAGSYFPLLRRSPLSTCN
jgi:hypothetical protein